MSLSGDNRSINVGGAIIGASIVTGNDNTVTTSGHVTLPPAHTVDAKAELAMLRELLAKQQTPERDKLDRACQYAADLATERNPDKKQIAGSLQRALTFARRQRLRRSDRDAGAPCRRTRLLARHGGTRAALAARLLHARHAIRADVPGGRVAPYPRPVRGGSPDRFTLARGPDHAGGQIPSASGRPSWVRTQPARLTKPAAFEAPPLMPMMHSTISRRPERSKAPHAWPPAAIGDRTFPAGDRSAGQYRPDGNRFVIRSGRPSTGRETLACTSLIRNPSLSAGPKASRLWTPTPT